MQSYEQLKESLHGALAFPITAYASNGSVDLDAVRMNAEWLATSGVCALVAPSGTGELFGMSPDECAAVTEATVDAVEGRIPVIASVGFGPRVAVDLARRAEQAGADGILVLPPYYAQPDPDALLDYYREISLSTSLGVIPYARDSAVLTPELVETLLLELPNLIGFKDGRGDVRQFQRIRDHIVERFGPDRVVWLAGVGDDLVAPYFACGASGFTSSLACFWPEASVEIYRLASTGDFDGLARFSQEVVRPIYELRRRRPGFEVSVMKAAMELLGHPSGPARPPLANLTDKDSAELHAILTRLNVPTRSSRIAAVRDRNASAV